MADRCRKAAGAKLELCEAANHAAVQGFIRLQTMRDMETGKCREQLSIDKGRRYAPLHFCPWCRASIDTRPIDRSGDAS